MTQKGFLAVVLALQVVCALFFVGDIILSVTGLWSINWVLHEYIEIGATLGLVAGIVMGALAIRRSNRRTEAAESRLRAASGAFIELLNERFDGWGLTPAERDVALFAIKGLSTQEIAQVRSTAEGTVKAQTNAIYRKAGVSGRPQLLSLFIDDLMAGPVLPAAAAAPNAATSAAAGERTQAAVGGGR